ncbi:MAG: hypothetical protein ACHRHE_19180 [Tepidisphaerales bacterium]
MPTDDPNLSQAPPRPRRPRVTIEELGGDMVLRYRRREWGGGCFLLLWLTGWTVGCVFLAAMVLKERKLFTLLFALPFWASWVFVAFLLANMLFRRETVRVGRGGVSYERRVLFPTLTREIGDREIKGLRAAEQPSRQENGPPRKCIRFETIGNPLDVFAGIDADEQQWLIAMLAVRFRYARPDVEPAEPEPPAPAEKPGAATRPSDSRIALWRRADEVEFTASGRPSWAALGVVTFLCLFWNGIVSVFIYQLFGKFEWGLFAFLIPFELIGLCIVGAWVVVASMPLWRHSWVFSRGEIVLQFRLAGLGLRRTRRVAVRDVAWFDVRPEPVKSGQEGQLRPDGRQGRFMVALLDKDDRELAAIRHLSEGEANWMAAEATRFYSRG